MIKVHKNRHDSLSAQHKNLGFVGGHRVRSRVVNPDETLIQDGPW